MEETCRWDDDNLFNLVFRIFDGSGMPICEAFAQIEQQPNIYDVVHVKYYDEVSFFFLLDILSLLEILHYFSF